MLNLIPMPIKAIQNDGFFTIAYDAYICIQPSCSQTVCEQAMLFGEKLAAQIGYTLEFTRYGAKRGDIEFCQDNKMKDEAYSIEISTDNICVTGSQKGLWHAMQTLIQLAVQYGANLPALSIEDEPSLPNRAYYFDCTRGRVPKLEWLMELADRMAFYKLNQLQLYVEHTYLFRDMTELWRDDTPLTAAEIMRLDNYCIKRGIELVPSLSSFGHLYKLLSSKSYSHLCELENSENEPFSVRGRMMHHTIDISNPESFELIKSMLSEYMQLFTSRQFNFCADETFDLGQGKSKEYLQKTGKDEAYIEFVNKIALFLLEKGRRPMFWGDIISSFPQYIKSLPQEIICLNWGYVWNQTPDDTKKLQQAGATQYCCPGCAGWNQLTTFNKNAYQNILRQCNYAREYGAIGVLNTDWGDYLHVNHPDLSRPGMIYGAAFSWNSKIPELDEINCQISMLEYKDYTGKLLSIVKDLQDYASFGWTELCAFKEISEGIKEHVKGFTNMLNDAVERMDGIEQKNYAISEIVKQLYCKQASMDTTAKHLLKPYILAAHGMQLFNELGQIVLSDGYGLKVQKTANSAELAVSLEKWLYHYKQIYRTVSRESELWRIQDTICFYADYLRKKA